MKISSKMLVYTTFSACGCMRPSCRRGLLWTLGERWLPSSSSSTTSSITRPKSIPSEWAVEEWSIPKMQIMSLTSPKCRHHKVPPGLGVTPIATSTVTPLSTMWWASGCSNRWLGHWDHIGLCLCVGRQSARWAGLGVPQEQLLLLFSN